MTTISFSVDGVHVPWSRAGQNGRFRFTPAHVRTGLFMLLTFAMAIFKMFMASMEAQATRNHELAMKAVEQAQASSGDPARSMFLGAGIVLFVIMFCLAMLKGKVK